MGPRKTTKPLKSKTSIISLLMMALVLGVAPVSVLHAGSDSQPSTETKKEELGPWTPLKKKDFANYTIEISQRMTKSKYPRVDSMKARLVPKDGGKTIEIEGTWLNPDTKAFVIEAKGTGPDLDGDGVEDLVLQNYSAGGHCCYNYLLYSLKKPAQKLGDIAMKDCGEKISFEDLNGDGKPELISCNPDFTYLGQLEYSESPFPPAIYALKDGEYKRSDREFMKVFQEDIQAQRDTLSKNYRPAAVLQIVTDYLVMGDEVTAWKEFDTLYKGADKDAIKVELSKRIGLKVPASDLKPASDTKPVVPSL